MDIFGALIPQIQMIILPKLLEAITIREYMDIVAVRKYQKQAYYIAWYPVFALWLYAVSILQAPIIVSIILNVLFSAATMMLLYQGKWYQKVAVAVTAVIGVVILDYLFLEGFLLLLGSKFAEVGSTSVEMFSTIMLTKLTEMLAVKIARGIIGYRRIKGLKAEDYFLYFLMPIVSIGVMDMLFIDCIGHGEASTSLTYAILGIVILDIAIFHMMHRMEKYYQAEGDMRVMNLQMTAQMDNIREIEQTHKRIRQISHGITTQLSAIETLLRHHKYAEAEDYLKSITDTVEQDILPIHTNNVVVDALLNQRYILARSKGIKMRFDIQDLQTIKIRTTDLVSIISNGLNNAIEACEAVTGNKIIELKILNAEEELLISIQNTVESDIVVDGDRIPTSKDDKLNHGFGLEAIRLVLERYHGKMFLECENHIFKLITVL